MVKGARWTRMVMVLAIVGGVCVLWNGATKAAAPELKGKFEIVKEEASTHQPGKVKLVEFADFYCPHCHHFEGPDFP